MQKPSGAQMFLKQFTAATKVGSIADPLLLVFCLISATTLFATSAAQFLLQAALYVPLFLVAVDRQYLLSRQIFFRRMWNILSLAYLPLLILDFRMSGEILHPVARLLFFIQLAKLYDRHAPRDRILLILISFFQILAASVLTTEAEILFGILLFIWMAFALLMTHSLLKDGGESSPRPPLFSLAALLTVAVSIISLGIFFLIPRLNTGYLHGIPTGASQISGFSEQMDLDQAGLIRKDSSIVMRVRRLDGEGPLDTPIYWRGIAYSTYDGRQWLKSSKSHSPQRTDDNKYQISAPRAGGKCYRFEFVVEPMDSDVVFAAGRALSLEGRFFWLVLDDNHSLYSRYQRYYRVSYIEEAEFRPLPENITDSETVTDLSLALPPNEDRLVTLAEEITHGARNKYDACRKIEHFLRTRYAYTLDIKRDQSMTAVDDFLFNQKRGHCEFFATSMALLCRAAGIPARVVSGFLEGEFNEIGNFYIVRQENAHAWVEAYFPQQGWLQFDPSPVDVESAFNAQISFLERIRGYWDSYKLLFDQYILTYNLWDQFNAVIELADFSRRTKVLLSQALTSLKERFSRVGMNLSGSRGWVVSCTLLIAIYLLIRLRRSGWAHIALGRTAGQKRHQSHVIHAYEHFLRAAASRGFHKNANETPLEFTMKFTSERRELCRELTELYYLARFGNQGLYRVEEKIRKLAKRVLESQ